MGLFNGEKSYIGLDIGNFSIKIVELEKQQKGMRLLTYGFTENISEKAKKEWHENIKFTALVINKALKKANVSSRNVVVSLPSFSVFSAIISLPNVSEKDIASAVSWEAKKVIPLPLEEMVLDWKVIEEEAENQESRSNIKVLLTGAPKALVKKYINIFQECQLNLLSIETETFSLIRALLGNDKTITMIIEVGANTTDISIISNSIPMLSRSIDVGGSTITRAISTNLNIGIERAEQFKYDLGITAIESSEDIIPKTIIETVNPIINEIKYMINLYQGKNNKKVEKIILSGGSSLIPNFVNYLAKILNMNVIIGDPWARVSYPVDLKPILKEIGPRFSVAVGLALRNGG